MPKRVYEIAKRLGLETKQVLTGAKALGIAAARVPSSSLDNITAEYLEEELMKVHGIKSSRGLVSVGLANFKAFAELQKIPLKPITLIFGANSSGKSTAIQGLLLACEGVATGKLDVFKTKIGGDSVDLGGFKQYVHRRQVASRVEWAAELETRNLQGNAYAALNKHAQFRVSLFIGVPLDDKGRVQRERAAGLISYNIEAGGEAILRMNKREDDGTMQILRFEQSALNSVVYAILASTTTAAHLASDEDRATILAVMNELIPQLRFECNGLLPERLAAGQRSGMSPMHPLYAIGKADRQKQLREAAEMFLPRAIVEVLREVNAELRKHLDKVTYLGPLRSCPPRHLAFLEETDRNWHAGGGFAWEKVRTDAPLREKLNQWLGATDRLKTPYRLQVEKLYSASEIQTSLETGFEGIGTDIVAHLLGDVQNSKADTGTLLAVRDEIEMARFDLEKALKEKQERRKALEQNLAVSRKRIEEISNHSQKLKIQRDLAISEHDEKKLPPERGSVDKLKAEIEMGQTALKVMQDTVALFEAQVKESVEDEEKILARLKELRRQKEDIFSELKANLDTQEMVKRLYDGIQNRPERNGVDELILVDCRTETQVTHRDVGIGVSQVLPVLVHAYADKGKIVAIEQPEIHLHPALQAELGDVFIESALGEQKNTFILETHSEHLILRILRRIRDTTDKKLAEGQQPIQPDDVAVLFVEPTSKGSVIRQMTVTADGDFAEPWPGGFFTERLDDLP